MFDTVRSSKRLVQIILLLIILPFALWGVESYVRDIGTGEDVAKVGEIRITPNEFQQALREQQDRLRSNLGQDYNPALLETPEARMALLESLVNQRLLALEARDEKLAVSDVQLRDFILTVPSLQVDGQFSRQRYNEVLRNQGLSQEGFEARLRHDIALQQIVTALSEGAMVSKTSTEQLLALQGEEREVFESVVKPEQFIERVKPSEEQVKAYYESNRKAFEVPEQVRAEYVVLNQSALADQVTVPEEEIKAFYERNGDRYRQPEERRASHILITVAKDATDEQVKAAGAKIGEIARQLQQNPDSFPQLAKQHSQDEGSAANGGDLGFFARGAMVKPFEDAVFSLKEGQVSDAVRTDFGFHLIKLTAVKPEAGKTYEQVRDEIEADLKRQAAGRKFAETAEAFSNIVYEQPESLKPAAEKFALQLRQSDWISKGSGGRSELGSERLVSALFADDAIKNRRNTEAVEISPGTLVSARVLEHRPASLRPLEAVSAEIAKTLTREEASRLAKEEGAQRLARLQKGETVQMEWSGPKQVKRGSGAGLSLEALRSVFKAPRDKLPAYAGAPVPEGGFGIYRITAVKAPSTVDAAALSSLQSQLARFRADQEFAAYLDALKQRYPVELNKTALESK